MTIAADFSHVEREDGARVAFTRSETRVLALMAQNPDRLLTRDQILDALSKPGSAKSDRNIDFLISQLRKKLGDDVRDPRFIATRYGEGYVWIRPEQVADTSLADVHLVVGPLHGLGNLGLRRTEAEAFAAALAQGFRRGLPAERKVVVGSNFPPAGMPGEGGPEQAAELTFFRDDESINCVVALRHYGSGRILAAQRSALPGAEEGARKRDETARELARRLFDEAWLVRATEREVRIPLPVAMFTSSHGKANEVGNVLDGDRRLKVINQASEASSLAAFVENETRLRNLCKTSPDDPVLKLMLAVAIHSKYPGAGHQIFLDGSHDFRADAKEMERLALEALPFVQSQPEHAVMTAKILHFVDRSYATLARRIAEDAHHSSIGVASTLATVSQLRAFAGETEASLDCIDQALSLVEPGTREYLYMMTIKALTLVSAADYGQLEGLKRVLYTAAPILRMLYEPLLADPRAPSLDAKASMMEMPRERAAAILRHQHYTFARQFLSREAGGNVLAGMLALSIRRFGPSVVHKDIADAFPDLVRSF